MKYNYTDGAWKSQEAVCIFYTLLFQLGMFRRRWGGRGEGGGVEGCGVWGAELGIAEDSGGGGEGVGGYPAFTRPE